MNQQILLVVDDKTLAQPLRAGLERQGYEVRVATPAHAAAEAARGGDAVVVDGQLQGADGLGLCERLCGAHPGLPVVVLAAQTVEAAVRALRTGVQDFLPRTAEPEVVAAALGRALQRRHLREAVQRLQAEPGAQRKSSALLGESAGMRELVSLLGRVADSESAVLVTGERGSGKELVARELHAAGKRRGGPFVVVQCAGATEAALEAELFGTPKDGSRGGALARVEQGTLLLEEVSELPVSLQARLLKVLQEPRQGARLVATTGRDLEAAVAERRFNEDLAFRLSVLHLRLQPLRARGNDVLLLAQHFTRQFAQRNGKAVTGLSSGAAEKLLGWSWPGNVRELSQVIERAVAVTRHAQLTVEDLPEQVVRPVAAAEAAPSEEAELAPMEAVERRHILKVLKAVGGHRTQAAKILGLDRKTLYRKLEAYGPGPVEHALRDAPPRMIAAPESRRAG